MAKAVAKPTTPAKPAPQKPTAPVAKPAPAKPQPAAVKVAAPQGNGPPKKYSRLEVNGVPIPRERVKVTATQWKKLLGWEVEKDYTARVTAANPQIKAEDAVFGEDFHLLDIEGNKIRLRHSSRNRPFSEPWAKSIAQDTLTKHFIFNGETVIIDEDGEVVSGQHRGGACIISEQMRLGKDKAHWAQFWQEEVYIECLVVTGVPYNQALINTLDTVRPRKLSDAFYTSDLFSKLGTVAKKECSRMLEKAVEFVWDRSGERKGWNHFQTTSASLEFLDRHPTLLKCVKHIFDNNTDRQLSVLKLSPGQCAGMMYFAASCESDGDAYRHADGQGGSPKEGTGKTGLDWGEWEKAKQFFVDLGNKNCQFVNNVRFALAALDGEGGSRKSSIAEKSGVLAKAWQVYRMGQEPQLDDMILEYMDVFADDGSLTKHILQESASFGGIDLGPDVATVGSEEKEPTPEELAAIAEQKRLAELEKDKAKLASQAASKAAKKSAPTPTISHPLASRPLSRKEQEASNKEAARVADEEANQPSEEGVDEYIPEEAFEE